MELVGRATELAQLEHLFTELKGGRGRLIVLSGPTGSGRTALARAFLGRVEQLDPAAVAVSASCVEHHTRFRAFSPFREFIARLAGLRKAQGLSALVESKAFSWLPGGPRAAGRNALFEQFVSLWRAIGERRPAVFMIDDIHWSDRSSIDLLTRLGSGMASLPVLVVATFDADTGPGAVSLTGVQRRLAANYTGITLRGLEAEPIKDVVEVTLDGASKDLGEMIAPLARGNPFYAEQVARWLAETGRIRRRLFKQSAAHRDLPSPGTDVEVLIRARLDAMEPNLRWTLEAAALAGSIVDAAVIAGQVGQEVEVVTRLLQEAQSSLGLLNAAGEYQWLAGARSTRFEFKHPLIRRVIAERVTGKRRAHLLSRAATTLAKLAGKGASEIADEIASLQLRAGPSAAALEWSIKGADLAEKQYAPYETEEFLRSAARIAEDESDRLKIEHRLATLYAATQRAPEAEKLLERVFESAQKLGDQRTEVGSGTLLGWIQLEDGFEPMQLSALVGHLVDKARSAGETDQLIAALDLACVVAERVGRAEEALLMAEEALHVGQGSNDPELLAQASYRLARVQISWGSPQEGKPLAQQALDIYARIGATDAVVACHDLLGMASFRAGDWDDASHHWVSALKRLEDAGVPEQRVVMLTNIAELKTFRGEFETAKELYRSGLRLAEELDDHMLILRCRAGLARLEFERGNYSGVLVLTEAIRKEIPESGAWREDFHTTAVRALSYLELGDELQAWQEAARLEQLYQGKEGWFERRAEGDAVRLRVIDLDSDEWLAGMVAEQGIGETADNDLYGEAFLQYHKATVTARTKPEDARKAARRAEELLERLGATPMLGRTRELLVTIPEGAVETEPEETSENQLTDEALDSWFDGLEG